jgi:hypothetical protein
MAERQYSETEVAQIFELAAKAQHVARRQVAAGTGMTLAELQEIGQEVGISPAEITQAAHSLDRPERRSSRTFLGFPIGVGRTVELGRRLSDEEWERLVVDLRETFDARGHIRSEGSFRQWTNGNLQALIEPTPTGDRLRLRTTKGSALSLMSAGAGIIGVSSAILIASVLSEGAVGPSSFVSIGIMVAAGLGMFGVSALRLPSWAQLRSRQMEAVANRVARLSITDRLGDAQPDGS